MMQGKVAVVTGGFGCLGSTVAHSLLQQGLRVAAIDRVAAPAGEAAPGAMRLGQVDLTQAGDATRAMDAVAATLGRIDVLVNIAGGFRWGKLADSAPGLWDEMYAVNLKTAVVATMAALPHLRAAGGGRIINIGAAAATSPGAGMGAYAASKAGVRCLTESLAAELAGDSITVNAVLPTIIDTPRNRADMPDADFSRWVSPQRIAELIGLLASEKAQAVSGASIAIGVHA